MTTGIPFNRRTAIKIDYNFVSNKVSFTGEMAGIFIAEKQVVLGFSFIAPTNQSKKWNELCENTIRLIIVDTPNGLTSFNWKFDSIKKYEAKNWQYIGYSGEEEKMSLYFIDPSIFVKEGVVVNIAINIVFKNPQNYFDERTRNATPAQKAALPKKSLLYFHQLFGIKCDTKQYQIFQEQVFWEDKSGNDVDFGKMSSIIAQKRSVSEVIVNNACK